MPLSTHAGNILLIIADDLGADSFPLTADAGTSQPPMPAVSALKQQGVLFRRASAQPTCSPTRASILTGRHPFRTGIGTAIEPGTGVQLAATEFTLPDAFAASPALGYTIASFGKWHLAAGAGTANTPATLGRWPHYAGLTAGALSDYSSWTKTTNGVSTTSTTYATTDTANDAVAWIQARGSSPWFLWVAFCAPHTPFHKPPNQLHSYDSLNPVVTGSRRPYFEAACEALDSEIARILAVIDLAETTVIFVGDNGTTGQVIQAPYTTGHAKSSLYEGGTRVPLLIAGAGVVAPNRESDAPVDVSDLHATILDLAGIDATVVRPASVVVDSRSLRPILQNTSEALARFAYSEQFGNDLTAAQSGQALRDAAGYKLIRFLDGREEFYDLNSDRNEQSPLAVGSLNATQLGRYHALKLQFGAYQQTYVAPQVQLVSFVGNSAAVRCPKVSEASTYTLYRATDLTTSGAWLPVSGALQMDEGASILLTDPSAGSAGAGRAFYRVLVE